MPASVDQKLTKNFQPEKISNAFREYEEAKRDVFDESVYIKMGADGISHPTFSKELDLRCGFISKRVLEGTYQFYPFREVAIPKPSGGERILSIATIRDVLVQKLLYETLYDEIEAKFKKTSRLDAVSWAYRKRKCAPSAAISIHAYIRQGFRFVLDADIVKFFDEIPHKNLLSLLNSSFDGNTRTINLLRRFIKTGGVPYPYKDRYGCSRKQELFHKYKPNRQVVYREKGIPQGGVLSGMLANLYLHSLDCWIVDDLSKRFEIRYIRYADDFVILLKEESQISIIHREIQNHLDHLELKMHSLESGKTKYLNIEEEGLKFVGFLFDKDHIRVNEGNVNKFKDRISNKLRRSTDSKKDQGKIEQDYNFGNDAKKRLNLFVCRVINRKILGSGTGICQACGGLTERMSEKGSLQRRNQGLSTGDSTRESEVQSLARTSQTSPDEKIRSWIKFFSAITDVHQLHEIDKWIRVTVGNYFWEYYKVRLNRTDFRNAGLASLEQEYYKIRKNKICKCVLAQEVEIFDT
jgi:RNA-directed DNA polymerase